MMRALVRAVPLFTVVGLVGCGLGDTTVPLLDDESTFVQSLDLASLQAVVLEQAAQVEVELLPGGLTAAELAVSPAGKSDEERVQSRAVDVAASNGAGTIRLLLEGVTIGFDTSSRFWLGEREVGMEDFLAELRADVEAGNEPPIVAERAVPDVPQAPDASEFRADHIALTGDGLARIRMDVDRDNFEMAAGQVEGDPDGWLLILGLRIALRVQDGTTEIESHDHDYADLEEFEGMVTSVSLSGLSVELADGTSVFLVERTHVVQRDGLLTSLAGVAEALESGLEVVAWGKGVVETEEPLSLLALKVAFSAHEPDEPKPELEEFEGVVAGASAVDGTLTLGDGTTVRILETTEVVAYDEASPAGVDGVIEALEEGLEVLAWGAGVVLGEEPVSIDATRVVLKARATQEQREEFEGAVVAVDPETGTVTFAEGAVIGLDDDSSVEAYNDYSPATLAAVAEQLERGHVVHAWGAGSLQDGTEILQAEHIVFKALVEDFEKDVTEIDVVEGIVVLESGWLLSVSDDTAIEAADDVSPGSLEDAQSALEAGDRVRVWGLGYVTDREPVSLDLLTLTIRRIAAG